MGSKTDVISYVIEPVTRAQLQLETLVVHGVPLSSLRVHDAMATLLPAAAANDDMGLVTGTPGTDAPSLQGVDFGGGASDEKAAFEFILPPNYESGGAIYVKLLDCSCLTTAADTSLTVDCEVWKQTSAGAVGSDLCATGAQSINSTTPAAITFTVTPTGLVAGDKLIVRLSFAGSDTGDAGVMIPEICGVQMLLSIRG